VPVIAASSGFFSVVAGGAAGRTICVFTRVWANAVGPAATAMAALSSVTEKRRMASPAHEGIAGKLVTAEEMVQCRVTCAA
jgi:hypothetical protein